MKTPDKRVEGNKIRVSWDIADGGDNWVVQFWKIGKDGSAEIFTKLDKHSDDGGSFDLLTPPSSRMGGKR